MKKCTENWVGQEDTTRTLTYRNVHHKWNNQMFVYGIKVLIYISLFRAYNCCTKKETVQ